MRRVRRAAGAAAFDAAVLRSTGDDSNNSVASDKYGKFNAAAARAKEMEASAEDSEQPLLSEKLRQQELISEQQSQNNNNDRRGPIMDSERYAASNKKKSSQAPSSGSSIGSLQRMQMEISAAKEGNRSKHQQSERRRKMNLVFSAFGDKRRIIKRVKHVMQCTKKEEDNNDHELDPLTLSTGDTNNTKQRHSSKVVFVMMLTVFVVFGMGRRKGRRIESEKESINQTLLRGQSSTPLLQVQTNNINTEDLSRSSNSNQTTPIRQVSFPSYFSSLSNLTEEYRPEVETPLFWDIHFSGESIAEAIFSDCHNLVMASEFGLRQPNYSEDTLAEFRLDGSRYVNVELNTKEGILRAARLGLANSHLADVIISPYIHNMASSIFTKQNPGRLFTIFRHPVDRALGMYHYLAKASWDPLYNPELRNMSISEFAKSKYIENNWMTRFLIGKTKGKLTHADMLLAKQILRYKVLVGLYDELDTSMVRFQRYFGWKSVTKTQADTAKCRSKAIARGDKNVLGHPTSIKNQNALLESFQSNRSQTVEEVVVGNAAWKAIERHNLFDMELYAFAKRVYALQGEHIFGVVG
jgi:hypothetical protein